MKDQFSGNEDSKSGAQNSYFTAPNQKSFKEICEVEFSKGKRKNGLEYRFIIAVKNVFAIKTKRVVIETTVLLRLVSNRLSHV